MLQFRQFVFFVHKNINDASNTKHKFYHILLISIQYKYRMIDFKAFMAAILYHPKYTDIDIVKDVTFI